MPKMGIHILWGVVSKRYLWIFDIFIFWALWGFQISNLAIFGYFWPKITYNWTLDPPQSPKNENIENPQITFGNTTP